MIATPEKLLAEFGLADDLAHFAETVGDVREAIELRLERGDVAGTFQTLRANASASLPKEVVADALTRAFRVDAEATSAFLRSREFLATALGGDAERASEVLGEICETLLVETNEFTSSRDDDDDDSHRRANEATRDETAKGERRKEASRRHATDLLNSAMRDGRVTSPRGRDAWRRASWLAARRHLTASQEARGRRRREPERE